MIDLDKARRRLNDRHDALITRTDRIERDLRRLPDADSAERVTEQENDAVLERLDETERAELARIDTALERVDQGQYETCARCGEKIDPSRLEAVPETPHCVDCA